MICRDIIEKIEETYPKRYAMEWDNVGLLVGRMEKEVSKIFLALDLTEEVIEKAREFGADLIITHHPFIFSPLRTITDQHFIGKRVLDLIQNDISCYAMHTNYDVLRMGDLAADILGIKEKEVLEVTSVGEKEEGIGKIGFLEKETALIECCEIVKERFAIPSVKLFGSFDKKVQKIAICPGSGKSVISAALKKGADVLLTGDIDHHEGIDALARNLSIIDAGHYGLEHIFIEDMRGFLAERFSDIEIKTMELTYPFQII